MMRLYDSARQALVDFACGPEVLLYTCGITPYDATHLGHAFTFLVFDVLTRRLQDLGHTVRCVRNVTDLDDPLFAKARSLGVSWQSLADQEERRLNVDLEALGCLPVASRPRVSDALDEIRAFIARALEQGHAYPSRDAVYFRFKSTRTPGGPAHLDEAAMLALARERGGNPDDPLKEHPLDFVLWQPSASDEPAFDSPWGPGRPGWHVGCSVLALRDLGPSLDIHGGGSDLVFPHHECERAQSEAVNGLPFARLWMHVAMVAYQGEKMSKSLGNLVFVDQVRAVHDPQVLRLALLAHHYRKPWEWYDTFLEEAQARLTPWRESPRRLSGEACLERVRAALDDDLDVPSALHCIDEAASRGEDPTPATALLGFELVPRRMCDIERSV